MWKRTSPFRAAGEGDGLAVLALIEKTFDGGEDPRLIAGVDALKRIVRRVG